MWQSWELGNDFYYLTWDFSEMNEDYPLVAQYLRDRGLHSEDKILIHFWW